jgi:hypothetical protein
MEAYSEESNRKGVKSMGNKIDASQVSAMTKDEYLAQFEGTTQGTLQTSKGLRLQMSKPKRYVLDIDKVKTLDDVKQVLLGLEIGYTLWGDSTGVQPSSYSKLEKYLKEEDHG